MILARTFCLGNHFCDEKTFDKHFCDGNIYSSLTNRVNTP